MLRLIFRKREQNEGSLTFNASRESNLTKCYDNTAKLFITFVNSSHLFTLLSSFYCLIMIHFYSLIMRKYVLLFRNDKREVRWRHNYYFNGVRLGRDIFGCMIFVE